MLDQLRSLADIGHEQGEKLEDRELQIRMLRTTHGLDRRLAVWQAVWRTTQGTVLRVSDLGLRAMSKLSTRPKSVDS